MPLNASFHTVSCRSQHPPARRGGPTDCPDCALRPVCLAVSLAIPTPDQTLLKKLAEYTHAFTCGEMHLRLSLAPERMLGAALEAVEAVYPAVQEMHQRRLDRIEKLSTLDLRTCKGPQLQITIHGCKDLMEGHELENKLPDPFVVVQFFDYSSGGYSGTLLHKFKTSRKGNTLKPVWEESFTFPVPPPTTSVKLVVWDHDLTIGDNFWGQATAWWRLRRPTMDISCVQSGPGPPRCDVARMLSGRGTGTRVRTAASSAAATRRAPATCFRPNSI